MFAIKLDAINYDTTKNGEANSEKVEESKAYRDKDITWRKKKIEDVSQNEMKVPTSKSEKSWFGTLTLVDNFTIWIIVFIYTYINK